MKKTAYSIGRIGNRKNKVILNLLRFFGRPLASPGMRNAVFRNSLIFVLLIFFHCCLANANDNISFSGVVNQDKINIRADSTVSSPKICAIDKDTNVEIIEEKYEWYKIKLPEKARVFVKKDLISFIDEKTAKGAKDNINIRLEPNETSAIIGKIEKNEVISVLGDLGLWLQIKPVNNSFGWINKKFVDKDRPNKLPERKEITSAAVANTQISQNTEILPAETIILEGIIKPYGKVIKRKGTHKLFTKDGQIIILKGRPDNLNSLLYHKVKITGKVIPQQRQKYSVVEIIKMEAAE